MKKLISNLDKSCSFKVKVGINVYMVRFVEENELEGATAEIDLEKNLIRMHRNLPLSQKICCFWHEIFHAINEKYDEESIEFLAQAMAVLLDSNKALFGHCK